jgi:hypothetical protein
MEMKTVERFIGPKEDLPDSSIHMIKHVRCRIIQSTSSISLDIAQHVVLSQTAKGEKFWIAPAPNSLIDPDWPGLMCFQVTAACRFYASSRRFGGSKNI